MFSWVREEFPNVTVIDLFDPDLWEDVNMELYHSATRKDQKAASLLSICRIVYEVIHEAKCQKPLAKGTLQTPQGLQGVPLQAGVPGPAALSSEAAETLQQSGASTALVPGEIVPPESEEGVMRYPCECRHGVVPTDRGLQPRQNRGGVLSKKSCQFF